jgi:hypothetical protein
MRFEKMSLVLLLALAATSVQAANKDFNVKYLLAIQEDGRLLHEARHQAYGFRVEILDDSQGVKSESSKNGRPYVTAFKGERYSVRLYNPLPVRVAVNLTVDGLNSISGKPSGISDGQKWMIDPYSSIIIPGWQVSGGESRRFFFTDKPKSYAKWQGDNLGKDLAANCGVIGAAYFWNQEELDRYYDDHPLYRTTYRPMPYDALCAKKSERMDSSAPAASGMGAYENEIRPAAPPQEQAGTGMGEKESHPTYEVDFTCNTGMYSPKQAVIIYYGFDAAPVPNPFPELGYAPEMPLH